jgi:hypothetical protein
MPGQNFICVSVARIRSPHIAVAGRKKSLDYFPMNVRDALFPFVVLSLAFNALPAAHAAKKANNWQQALQTAVAEKAVGSLLDNELPLKLDASTLFPTVSELPGEPFQPKPLHPTTRTINEPLPPGDYVIRAVAYCSEYSVHRPGAGVAYEVGPIQGKAAQAISALLWRGTIEKRYTARQLQTVSWAIQAGLTYDRMPKTYQTIIDDLIPDQRAQLNGDFFQHLEDLYKTYAKSAGLPPFEKLLAGMGKSGELALAADRQRKALLRKNTTDQIRDQTLFAGQQTRIAPVKPSEGRWTEKIPGVAYVRYRVAGGNLHDNNEIELRILPAPAGKAVAASPAQAVFASYVEGRRPQFVAAGPQRLNPPSAGPTLSQVASDSIGYSTSRAAQVLFFVPVVAKLGNDPKEVGKADQLKGVVTLTRDGASKPLSDSDSLSMNDTITTGANGRAELTLADGTQITMGANAKITIDNYVYDPSGSGSREHFTTLGGVFSYVSGLIGASEPRSIDTPMADLGIRGTEFVARYLPSGERMEIDLVSGSLTVTPKDGGAPVACDGPVLITFDAKTVQTSMLTPQQIAKTKATWFSR